MSLALMVMDPRPAVMVGRVVSLMLTVDGIVGWYNSSELCWTALLDRHTWSIVGYCVMVGRVASLVPVADGTPPQPRYTPSTPGTPPQPTAFQLPAMVFVYEIMY